MHTIKWLKNSIWPIDRILTSITNLDQSGPESNYNEGVLHISQSSRTRASPSKGWVSYPGHLLGVSYPFVETQLAYSTASADWVTLTGTTTGG